MKKILRFIKQHMKILVPMMLALIVVIVVVTLIFTSPSNQIKKALNPNNSAYDCVQIEVSESTEAYFTTREELEQAVVEDVETEITAELIMTIHKEGTTYYQSSSSGETYFYREKDKEYILSYDDFFGLEEEGKWVKSSVEETGRTKYFDFDLLKGIDSSRIQVEDGRYVPEMEYRHEMFYQFLGVPESSYKKYMIYSISMELDGTRIDSVSLRFVYDGDTYIERTYQFNYEKKTVKLPKH